MKHSSTFFFAIILTLIVAPASHAAIVTYNFTANQDFASVNDSSNVAGAASTFATISGSITFDTSVADTNGDPLAGQFATGGITVNEFSIPDYSVGMTIFDGVNSEQFSLSGLSGPESVLLSLQAFNNSVFPSDALPMTLALSSFNALNELQFFSNNGFTQFTLTSLTLDSAMEAPLPAALPFFLLGLGALGITMRKGKVT